MMTMLACSGLNAIAVFLQFRITQVSAQQYSAVQHSRGYVVRVNQYQLS
jgi:hypothetical protein